jgi:hypothetical protein
MTRLAALAGLRESQEKMNITGNIVQAQGAVEMPSPTPAPTSRSILTTLDEVREACVTVAAVARRCLTIYTPDLEPQLYDTHAFLEVVKRLVLARSYARVRVLIAEPMRTIREGNRFLAMGRRLTSYIDLRNVHTDYRNNAAAFLIADDRALVYRLQASRWDGMAEMNDTAIARKYLSYFDEVWRASEPEPEVRMMRG